MFPVDRGLRRAVLALFILVPVAFGVIALWLGQDSNWDLRNYHWYNAYAALEGRLDQDMGAAQTPTYYNPTLDVPFYLLGNALPARPFTALLGALQGCNFILLHILAWYTLRLADERWRVVAAAGIALTGIIGGGHLSLVGAVFYDNIVSLFVFGALAVILGNMSLLRGGPFGAALLRTAFAGFLVGCGVGLKLPTQIFAIGVCFGLLFVPGPFVRRFFLSFACGLGVIGGFLVFGGWWMWELITHFDNPLFPYFNDIIRSPWALPESYRDDRFLPKSITLALTLPFRLFADATVAGEVGFRDARVLGAYIVLLATPPMLLIAHLKKFGRTEPFAQVFAARYLAAAAGLSYAVWLALFGIYRYLIPIEMLAPLLVVACMAFWPLTRQRQLSLAIGLLGFMVITMQPGNWGRMPWSEGGRFVEVTPPPLKDPATTLVIMTGFAPTAFVIPAFPREVAFLRPQSYLVEPTHATRFNEVLRARIAAHTGEMFILQATWEKAAGERVLPFYNLRTVPGSCRPLPTNLDGELELCGVEKIPAAEAVP